MLSQDGFRLSSLFRWYSFIVHVTLVILLIVKWVSLVLLTRFLSLDGHVFPGRRRSSTVSLGRTHGPLTLSSDYKRL